MDSNGILLVLQIGATVTDCGAIAKIPLRGHHVRTRRFKTPIYPYLPVADLLQPVKTEIAQSWGCSMLGQVISGATREQSDRGKPGGEVTEQLNRSRQRSCLVRIIHNRRQRAVEIETDRSCLRLRRQPRSMLSQNRLTAVRHDLTPVASPRSPSEKVCREPGRSSTVCSRTETVMGAAGLGRELISTRCSEKLSSTRWPR
jgi:hypothetical protein